MTVYSFLKMSTVRDKVSFDTTQNPSPLSRGNYPFGVYLNVPLLRI